MNPKAAVIDRTSPYSPAVAWADPAGFQYDQTSPMWKEVCSVLPCDKYMAWPKYDTATYETTIGGTEVVIQCWKGICEDLVSRIHLPPPFGNIEFPGGFGAEVGVYVRDDSRSLASAQMPAEIATWPPFYRAMAKKWFAVRTAHVALLNQGEYWWPATDLFATPATAPSVWFEMRDPVCGDLLISKYSTNTYWTCEWMRPESWMKWIGEWVLRNHELPSTWPSDYVLDFGIGDLKFTWDSVGIQPV